MSKAGVQEDKALLQQTQSAKLPTTLVMDLQPQQSSLDLWEEMCTPGKGTPCSVTRPCGP